MFAMGDPFIVDYQLGVCCTFAVGTKGHVRQWLWSWAQCGVLGFWLPFPGPERYRPPLYATREMGAPIVPVSRQRSWFSVSALWHNSSINGILSDCLYTGQQKKGYKVICLLFYKTEWHILFVYCKHNVCCLRVDLQNLNQVQRSETSECQFEWFCTTSTISPLLGTIEAK